MTRSNQHLFWGQNKDRNKEDDAENMVSSTQGHFFPRNMMWSSNTFFSPAAENPGVQRHHVAKAASTVTPVEGDTCECESLDSSLEKPKQSRSD